jgi:hypothetical protein
MLVLLSISLACALRADTVDLSKATVVVRGGARPPAERTAAEVLTSEIAKRTGIHLPVATSRPVAGPAIVITGNGFPQSRPDGYRLSVKLDAPAVVSIQGADARGALYGVGQFLRRVEWDKGRIEIEAPLDISTAPAYAIRGHQLGYRTHSNTYDAWDAAQFEQQIRELSYFGVNAVEGIPLDDEKATPVMKVPHRLMNRAIGEICRRYGMDYWVWVPVTFDLKDTAKRAEYLARFREFSTDTPTLSGIFFPGGDPGSNPPELVIPLLEDIARLIAPVHPQARIWLSMQQFKPAQVDFVYRYIDERQPAWLGGLAVGPSSPSLADTRRRLPKKYKIRWYPDITHNKLCQFQVPDWDQAYALTLGREGSNPRPVEFAAVFRKFAPYTDGFISYSEGVHDDVNKTVFSERAWNPEAGVRDILVDYARVHFKPELAERVADAILALEVNWRGPLIDNGAVEGTWRTWRELEQQAPDLSGNWRWQLCLLRANYDALVRRRLVAEAELESRANAAMADAGNISSTVAMERASAILNQAVTNPASPELRTRVEQLCESLFHLIGLQSSMTKYYVTSWQHGAILDYVDIPLNNRWWLEDEFRKVAAMPLEADRVRRLRDLAAWEHPRPGSFYDDLGNIGKSPHVIPADARPLDESERRAEPTFWAWDQGRSRARLSWQTTMWPVAMVYAPVDPNGVYIVRSSGYGRAVLRINGELVNPTLDGRQMGEFKEFPVASKFLTAGKLVLTWERPDGEESLNWRQRSRLAEVWLLKKQ